VVEALIHGKVEIVPAPRKFSDEMRERARRMVREARVQEPGLSINAACKRIGPVSEDGVTCRLGDDVTCRWVRRGDYGMAAPVGVRVRSLSR